MHRKLALEGHRFTPAEALEMGLVDHLVKGKTADIVAKAEEIADSVSINASQGAWGLIKVIPNTQTTDADANTVPAGNLSHGAQDDEQGYQVNYSTNCRRCRKDKVVGSSRDCGQCVYFDVVGTNNPWFGQ